MAPVYPHQGFKASTIVQVINHQRNVIYKRRRRYLAGSPESKDVDLKAEILDLVKQEITELVTVNLNSFDENGGKKEDWDTLLKTVATIIPVDQNVINKIKEESGNAADREFAIADGLYKFAEDFWNQREKEMGKEIFEGAQRFVALQSVDSLWMEHLDTMDHLRDSVRLRGWGQRDPLVEYKKEGFTMFQRMLAEVNKQIVYMIFHVGVTMQQVQAAPQQVVLNKSESGAPVQTGGNGDLQAIASQLKMSPEDLAKVGRNDACPCGAKNPDGSHKKFKKCHGKNL